MFNMSLATLQANAEAGDGKALLVLPACIAFAAIAAEQEVCKELTVAEIEKLLGYAIKIVS